MRFFLHFLFFLFFFSQLPAHNLLFSLAHQPPPMNNIQRQCLNPAGRRRGEAVPGARAHRRRRGVRWCCLCRYCCCGKGGARREEGCRRCRCSQRRGRARGRRVSAPAAPHAGPVGAPWPWLASPSTWRTWKQATASASSRDERATDGNGVFVIDHFLFLLNVARTTPEEQKKK